MIKDKTVMEYDKHIVIDSVFLNKSIMFTKSDYSKIYPERNFRDVHLEGLINGLKQFVTLEGNIKIIILETNFSKPVFYNSEISLETDTGSIDIVAKKLDFVTFGLDDCAAVGEIFKEVILFADDPGYIPAISSFRKKGIKFILVRYSNDLTTILCDEIVSLKWVDAEYIIGLAMGLERHEL